MGKNTLQKAAEKAVEGFAARNQHGLDLTPENVKALWASLDKYWDLRHIFTIDEYKILKEKLNFRKIEDQQALEKALNGDKMALSNLVIDHANVAHQVAKAEGDEVLAGTIERLAKIARDKRTEQAKKTGEKAKPASFPATLQHQQEFNGEQTVMLYAIKSAAYILGITPVLDLVGSMIEARSLGYTNWFSYALFVLMPERTKDRFEDIMGRPGEGQDQSNNAYGEAAAVAAANAGQSAKPAAPAPKPVGAY